MFGTKILSPVDAFSDMFVKHLQHANFNLNINNLILLRNVLKQAIKDSHLDAADESKIQPIEEIWEKVNVGCGCTRTKRVDEAMKATINFISSGDGAAMLSKIKTAYNLNTLTVDIIEPPYKCEV